jgi:serine/threonine-protein kinase
VQASAAAPATPAKPVPPPVAAPAPGIAEDLQVTAAQLAKPSSPPGGMIFEGDGASVTAPGRPLGSGDGTQVPVRQNSLVMAGGAAHQQVVLGGAAATSPAMNSNDRHAAMLGTTPLLDLGRFVPGTMLGQRYRIAGRLGKGGMGEVYRADDLKLGQSVAMKFLPEELSQDNTSLTRLINEVKIARHVSHPNVCRVYDIGDMDGVHFISMEYVDGEDLGTLLRRIGRLPHDKAVQIARQMCAGMQAAHEKGVLHRDLKPANIMIDGRGAVRIMDFGLAGLAEELKQEGSRAGTPAYMAPEQLQGKGVTARSDIYSLGLVLYEIFTGKPAYRPHSMAELVALHEKPLASCRTIVPEIPEEADAAVMRCIEREPAARPGSALQVAAALGGQDPLAAALAAGEMPSPELVAASGGQGTLSFATAASVLGTVLVLLLVLAGLNPKVRLYEVDRPSHPSVLTERARDVLKKVGANRPEADTASGFFEERLVASVKGADGTLSDATVPPVAAMRFWYRQSPTPLLATSAQRPLGPSEPPSDQAGMNLVVLDSQGKLVKLEASPTQASSTAGGAVSSPDFASLLAMAAVPSGEPTAVPSAVVPRLAADSRAAWEWKDGEGRVVHVEAAAVGSTPVYLEVFPRWIGAPNAGGSVGSGLDGFLKAMVLYTLVYGGTIALAWYNWKLGRGDRRGAMRLAMVVFAGNVAAWFLQTRFVFDGAFFDLLTPVLGNALYWAALMWLLYMAIEPFIRQVWPQSLISWSRLLSGEVRDGLVGRDLLFGCALGAGWTLLVHGLYMFGGSPKPLPLSTSPEMLMGLGPAIGGLIEVARDAVLYIFIILLLVPISRGIVRKLVPPSAVVFVVLAAVFAQILALQSGRSSGNGVAVVGVVGVLLALGAAYVLTRFGALMLMAAFFTAGVLLSYPLTLDTGSWYFGPGAVAALAIAGMAGFGFRRTLARRAMPAGWN